jgi:hypothetical protein
MTGMRFPHAGFCFGDISKNAGLFAEPGFFHEAGQYQAYNNTSLNEREITRQSF